MLGINNQYDVALGEDSPIQLSWKLFSLKKVSYLYIFKVFYEISR